ncbi:F0F1 ATP synthase subunit delta [Candidatus Roizmanbacteria bacterium]|nr:F0F1 ATP synthase subunit delta [Candidatus Roizmanbacteria bacterium]
MKLDPQTRLELKMLFQERLDRIKERVTVVSSHKLTDEEISLLFKKVGPEKKPREVEYVVDKSLLAGIVVKIGSKVMDFSLKGRLNNLQETMYEVT